MARGLAFGRSGEQVELAEQFAELAERRRPGEVAEQDWPGIAMGDVVEHVVGDVLADALLAVAAKVNHRRRPGELAEFPVVAGELVCLDRDRHGGEAVVGSAHGRPD